MWFKVNNRPRPNDINQYNPDGPIITKANSAYELMSNEGQQTTTGNNCTIGDTTDDVNMSPIYDNPDLPKENPLLTPPRFIWKCDHLIETCVISFFCSTCIFVLLLDCVCLIPVEIL